MADSGRRIAAVKIVSVMLTEVLLRSEAPLKPCAPRQHRD
jgi:hypothetical protein